MQRDVMTDVQTPFCLRLKGAAEVNTDAVMTQQHMTQVYREDVTPSVTILEQPPSTFQ